jgi:hypothetical protein
MLILDYAVRNWIEDLPGQEYLAPGDVEARPSDSAAVYRQVSGSGGRVAFGRLLVCQADGSHLPCQGQVYVDEGQMKMIGENLRSLQHVSSAESTGRSGF